VSVTEIKTAIAKLPSRQRQALAAWVQQQAATQKSKPLREHGRVRLLKAVSSEQLKAGALGSVVHIYAKGKACEVEFPRKDGSAAVVTLEARQLEVLQDS
jgi:hypothetical protein